jgi:hypothetical protein
MSAPTLQPAATPDAAVCESLSKAYLSLWRQISDLVGDNKWLEVRPAPAATEELPQEETDRLDPFEPDLRRYCEQTRRAVRNVRFVDPVELAVFRNILRDKGLEYAARADVMLQGNKGTASA